MILEANIKNSLDIIRYCKTLKTGIYAGCSITSKKHNFDMANALSAIVKVNSINIIPTFSCKANYDKNASSTYDIFLGFINTIKSFNLNQILLVSGNPKLKLDSLEVLNEFNDSSFNIAVAYNPYSKDLVTENQRLLEKLKHPNVNQVWLQLGQNCDKLKIAFQFIKSINPELQIVNCILEPNMKLLKSLQFRPWSGVYYTDQFYNDLDFALQNIDQMKQLSRDLGLEILISGV
jgi:hypothetical protein